MSNTVSRKDVGFRSERGPILIALMLTTGLVAIDSTILATAVSSIVVSIRETQGLKEASARRMAF